MTHLRENYWAVEALEGATNFDINRYGISSELNYWVIKEGKQKLIVIDIPPGTWEIVCTSKEATEDNCALIAGLSFQDVVHGYSRTFFHDLLTSKGCDLNKHYLILKKV